MYTIDDSTTLIIDVYFILIRQVAELHQLY